MRQQKSIRLNHQQQGYILIIVLSILVLISLLVVSTFISTDLSIKSNTFSADKKYALTVAEQATEIASKEVAQAFINPNNKIIPPISSYNQALYPIVFYELLENGPDLTTYNGEKWPPYFSDNCDVNPGFCSPAVVFNQKTYGLGLPVVARNNVFNEEGSACSNAITIPKSTLPNISARNPCYVVEFLGINPERVLRYRITVIAWGRNSSINVKIESIFEINYD